MKLNTVKYFAVIATATFGLVLCPIKASANSIESEFKNVLAKYNINDVIVENGISLSTGESVDLSEVDWELSNAKVVQIDSNGCLTAIGEGTVYISKEINGKVHIIEVFVEDEKPMMLATSRAITSVNRNYYKVFIDPGHGGSDPGAVANGYKESEINLQIAKKVESKLKAKGIQVKMSRTDNTFVALSTRASMANNYGADAFVSIHQNSSTATSAYGIESYYSTRKTKDKPLASTIQNKMVSATGDRNRGVLAGNFTVINRSNMVATLLETGFISNKSDASKISDSSYQDKLATAIANGVESYLKENVKLTNSETNNSTGSNNTTVIKTGVVTGTNSLNVRSGAGTSYSILGKLSKGAKVEITKKEDNGWYKIKYKDGYGYISGDYVSIGNSIITTPTKYGYVYNTATLNMRSGAGTSYEIVGTLKENTKVEIISEHNGWYKIKYGNGYAYVSANYITLKEPTTTPETPSTASKTGVVYNASSLNVRNGAGTSYAKIGSLNEGAKVEIVGEDNGWYKIKYGNGYGYVSANYITLKEPATTPETPSTASKTGVVYNASSLNVRNGAGTSYAKIGSLNEGAKVEILSESNGWYKIKYGSGYGYISADYVKINNTQSTIEKENIGTVTADKLNLRSGAGTSYAVKSTLTKGTKVTILSESNGWYNVKLANGTTGWVSVSYIAK